MPSALPEADPAPSDGRLPADAVATVAERPLGVYVHVPFCATRCGYCDFNTYTATELGGGASQVTYAQTAGTELTLAAEVLSPAAPPASTVFFGGGTPTLLPAADLAALLAGVRETVGLTADAEVTTEANPESVDERYLDALRAAGFTRISFGMQSARPHVLAALDRRHTPGRVEQVVQAARRAGFEHLSVDLIYGAPGETDEDWQASLEAAVALGTDHVSAYALVVEQGTRLARQVSRGEVAAPEDDVLADRYVQADETLTAAGLPWYEVSNWASSEAGRCRHNELYWSGAHWWGVGPGAHSHVGGVRWWNHRHPAVYARALAQGLSPAAGREVLDAEARHEERLLLGVRLVQGLPLAELSRAERAVADQAGRDGLVDPAALAAGRLRLTRRGRLLADGLVRDLVLAEDSARPAAAGQRAVAGAPDG